MTQTKIGTLEMTLWVVMSIIFIATAITDFSCPYISTHFDTQITVIYSFAISALAALTILFFQRLDRKKYLNNIYKNDIGDTYERVFIDEYGYNTDQTEPLRGQNIKETIKLTYLGGHIIQVDTKYWSKEVRGILQFAEDSQFLATGTYRYINEPDTEVGTYEVHRFADYKDTLYVYYQRTIPDDRVKGYEIWKRLDKK